MHVKTQGISKRNTLLEKVFRKISLFRQKKCENKNASSFSQVRQTPMCRIGTGSLSILLFLAILSVSPFCPAQTAHAQMNTTSNDLAINLGVRGGVAQGDLRGDGVRSSDARSGFYGGGLVAVYVNEYFSLQSEINYSSEGASEAFLETSSPIEDSSVELEILRVPVLAKLDAPISPVTPRLYVGPQIGFLLSTSIPEREEFEGDFDGPSFSGVVGGEIAYDLNRIGAVKEIALDGRFNFGISDIAGNSRDFVFGVRSYSFTGAINVTFGI